MVRRTILLKEAQSQFFSTNFFTSTLGAPLRSRLHSMISTSYKNQRSSIKSAALEKFKTYYRKEVEYFSPRTT